MWSASAVARVLAGLALGIGMSIVFAAVAYTATKGQRDFNSVQQTVATRYEILCEHKVAQEARDLLSRLVLPNRPF